MAVISILSVFAKVVLVKQVLIHGSKRIDLQGMISHVGHFLEDFGIVDGFTGIFSPGKRGMVGDQHPRHRLVFDHRGQALFQMAPGHVLAAAPLAARDLPVFSVSDDDRFCAVCSLHHVRVP